MIVRERENEFVLIKQHDHAQISGEIVKNWRNDLWKDATCRCKSVEYAIYNHDLGWKPVDEQPFWNDQKQKPYSFIDFPTPLKTVFYKHGIDEVMKHDSYAGLLCSRHYMNFLLQETSREARAFVDQETERQQQIAASLSDIDKAVFDSHYALLQLCDSLSLYLCLNEPGVLMKDGHPFFRDGVPIPSALEEFHDTKMELTWKDQRTIAIHEFPLENPLPITLKQKIVTKEDISTKGFIPSYEAAPLQKIDLLLVEDETDKR
ncbi:DUF3891 family protein [Virgibacillus sp. NKC19-3]|uniref:DUF3891 family protein n=1 Tax=Virgibacillus saliphilus TaxID=2831674 RepID=UPI001C9AE429|nr:DUF3891 family protein [Virgibacillus sp. NKC19-3]MBY7142118.1 DUF3891 family protein [Virgibacillus sp. NKC19-3]